jgi:hypothetical protein
MSSDAPIGWVAAFAGAYFLYAAIADKNPVSALTSVLTSDPGKVKPIAGYSITGAPAGHDPASGATIAGANGATSGGGGSFAPVSTASSAEQQAAAQIAATTGPPYLVTIAGGHKLAPIAAAGYERASAKYGRPIPITGAYRSYAVQSSAYATDPDRFAPPDRSLHPKGLAIDVNSANQSEPALVAALSSSGWAQTALPKEPWHWSFGVRG